MEPASAAEGAAGAGASATGPTPEGVPAPRAGGAGGRVAAVTRLNCGGAATSIARRLDDTAALDEPPKPVRRLAAKVRAAKTDFAVCFRVLDS